MKSGSMSLKKNIFRGISFFSLILFVCMFLFLLLLWEALFIGFGREPLLPERLELRYKLLHNNFTYTKKESYLSYIKNSELNELSKEFYKNYDIVVNNSWTLLNGERTLTKVNILISFIGIIVSALASRFTVSVKNGKVNKRYKWTVFNIIFLLEIIVFSSAFFFHCWEGYKKSSLKDEIKNIGYYYNEDYFQQEYDNILRKKDDKNVLLMHHNSSIKIVHVLNDAKRMLIAHSNANYVGLGCVLVAVFVSCFDYYLKINANSN